MADFSNPAEIARETLKQMAMSRLLPTPDNYRKTYCQIAGVPVEDTHPVLQLLTERFSKLQKPAFELQRTKQVLDDHLQSGNWNAWIEKILESLADASDVDSGKGNAWAELVRDLIKQWDLRQAGWTTPKKKEALEKVLINFGSKPDLLFTKLDALVTAWSDNVQLDDILQEELEPTPSSEIKGDAGQVFQAWRDLLIYTLEYGVVARLTTAPDLHEEAMALVTRLRETTEMKGLEAFSTVAKKFWLKLELRNESDQTLMLGLQRLLRLLVNNISELVADDSWMQGQVEVIRAVIDQPLDSRFLYEMEESLSELIFKQGHLKQSLVEAKHTFKNMITSFIDRLSTMASSTGSYHDKIVSYSSEIKQTDDLTKIASIVDRLMDDTRSMQLDMLRSRDELVKVREEAEKASEKVTALEKEIELVSEQVRTDQLTGVLNRRGMEDAFATELSRANREHKKLSIALLDIDNFKKLNDRLGHQAGDMALAHLAKVVKDVLRPTDSVARYGGEEFVILLPSTPVEEGVLVMQRVQRELTKRFYLHNNERVLITFSCGVAEYREGEDEMDVIGRADSAMYQAKLSGKNRVEISE
ncbi:GGDEF domain-containing protein [Leeia sp. TBRC 13508]|uniref:diguanylate cyclase n=1 Tax=Leeia speluncae TaxID=2884804 RepID=A0ABS8D9U0_9NEIS|nr:GGDEF domain-containing protein [Leeia speluncae]MCB6184783.1 GGDEF domain-containing protein [Leeia speluncae]